MSLGTPTEYTLVEKPIPDALKGRWGYRYLHPSQHPTLRPRENEVLFLPLLVDALVRLNGIPRDVALAIAQKLSGESDNREWLDLFRGRLSHKVPSDDTHRTLRLIDFDDPTNNDFAVTMVDEAHRAQDKDLGAYLRAVLPDAVRFGFTGTSVKQGDLDTFEIFGVKDEACLDKYGIDDAVADGATGRRACTLRVDATWRRP